ncbi:MULTISPECIES: flagellin [unclassified Arsukibacterium]|uniref:flagellin n=1 Tax=unclassified Arsukibacterium TaxID=2635278 RepID=UPI000C953F32|nr:MULTISPECIES: flagellin [unclassified Arsukibacterium]MAA96310.1 flagellin [Rheinheimera sp.]|tara:strand:+ start:14864 stop:15655 length:792 start_codon:yes stop_codon:yes gene_type:complete
MKLNNATGLNSLNQVQQQQESLLKKSATARRINTAADDAAGLQIANRLTSTVNEASQGQRNLYNGIGLAQVYEQSLQNINNDLSEVGTLAVAAGNGIYTDADRQALQQQAQGLLDNVQNTLQTASFGGVALFNDNNIAFNSGQSNLNLKVEDLGAALAAQDVFTIDLSTQAGAAAANTSLTEATAFVNSLQAEAGASINSFAAQARNLNNQQINQAQARSRIEDLDYAKAISEKTAADMLSQSSTSVTMQARMQQQQALTLLG